MRICSIRKSGYPAVDWFLLQTHQLDAASRSDRFVSVELHMLQNSFESPNESKSIFVLFAQKRREALGCGFVAFWERSGMAHVKSAYIDLLAIAEKHRSKGIGRMLYRAVQQRALLPGENCIDLMVWSYNNIAEIVCRSYATTPQRCAYEFNL